jgi:hypothetical protein
MRVRVFVLVALATASISPAIAYDKLPTTAKPMPAADLQKAYAGKTAVWKDGAVYWAPDGKAIGVTPNNASAGDGTWEATDGKVCYHITWMGIKPTDTPYPLNNCFGYMIDGKHVFHQFTSDKMKSDTGWWGGKSDLTALKTGNTIQSRYDAIKAKMPKT